MKKIRLFALILMGSSSSAWCQPLAKSVEFAAMRFPQKRSSTPAKQAAARQAPADFAADGNYNYFQLMADFGMSPRDAVADKLSPKSASSAKKTKAVKTQPAKH